MLANLATPLLQVLLQQLAVLPLPLSLTADSLHASNYFFNYS